jgi:hypothetical protein
MSGRCADEPPFDSLRELADEVDAIAALLRCPLGHGLTKRRLADVADELREMADG